MTGGAAGWLRADAAERLLPVAGFSGRLLGLLAALLGFFAALALALAVTAGRLAATWQGEMADTATLQVFAASDVIEDQARAALNVLKATPGVTAVRMVDMAEQEKLLEPWLGPDIPVESLPLPLLIEVSTDRATLDAESLVQQLQMEAPGAVYDDHAAWREPLVATAERLRLFALVALGLLALAMAAGLALGARTALAASRPALRTMRLVGAADGFIAGAMARRLTRTATVGAMVGTMAGMVLLALLPAADEQGFFLAGIGLTGWHWVLPLVVPLAVAAMAMGVARQATLGSLRRGG